MIRLTPSHPTNLAEAVVVEEVEKDPKDLIRLSQIEVIRSRSRRRRAAKDLRLDTITERTIMVHEEEKEAEVVVEGEAIKCIKVLEPAAEEEDNWIQTPGNTSSNLAIAQFTKPLKSPIKQSCLNSQLIQTLKRSHLRTSSTRKCANSTAKPKNLKSQLRRTDTKRDRSTKVEKLRVRMLPTGISLPPISMKSKSLETQSSNTSRDLMK